MENNKEINAFVEKALKEPETRLEIVKRSHPFFFVTYYNRYMTYPMAQMHYDMFNLTEDQDVSLAVVSAFRESAKSTIMNQSYTLWSVLGVQKKKFIVIVSRTEALAKSHYQDIKRELENNKLLRQDLGPFQEDTLWNSGSLIIPRYNARIVACSIDQSIRGMKHGEHRPDLIICDDLEDINSVRYLESREKTYKWFNREIMPLGSRNTKIVVLGNLLHEDSLVNKLKSEIQSGERTGTYREYPIIDDKDKIYWPGKFPGLDTIETERKKYDKFTWANEFLLKIVGDREPIIERDWVHYYQQLPAELRNQDITYAAGVDLAVSEKTHADYTAIVKCKIVGTGKNMKIYILSNPINTKMPLPTTIETICRVVYSFKDKSYIVYIEEVGTQMGVTQLLKEKDVKAKGVSVGQKDKHTRLALISDWIREGKIIFPANGADDLLQQMLNFGLERHDDLVDALTTLIIGIMEKPPTPAITYEQVQQMGKALRRSMYPDIPTGESRGGWGIEFVDGIPYRRY